MASIALLLITMLYPLLNTIWIFLLLRLFHGTAWGVSTTANSTMAVDSIPKARLEREWAISRYPQPWEQLLHQVSGFLFTVPFLFTR